MARNAVESTPLTAGPPAAGNNRQRFFEEQARKYPVPPEWSKGPVPDRRRWVTDSIFLALFVGCLLLMGLNTLWAFAKSTEGGFNRVRDSSGNVCGAGKAKAYPFLYLQTFAAPYRSVCVRKCPSFDYGKVNPAGLRGKNGAAKRAAKPVAFEEFSKKHAGRSHTYERVLGEREAFEFPKFWANGRFSAEQWEAYLQGYAVDCLPNEQFAGCRHGGGFSVYDSYAAARKVCVPLSPKAALLFNRVAASYRLGLAEDVRLAFPLFVRVAVFAVLLSLALFALAYALPRHSSAALVGLALLGLLGVVAMVAQGLFGHGALNDAFNPLRVKYLQFWLDNRLCALAAAAAALLAAALLAFYAVQHRRYLPLSSHTARLTARQTLRSGLLLGLTAAILLAQVGAFLAGAVTIGKLCATGRELAPAGAPLTTYASPAHLKLMIAVHVLGVYWALAVLEGLRDFVIAAITVDFYFSAPINPLHVLCHTLGHHVGSLALFALLLPLRLLRRWACGLHALAGAATRGRAGPQAVTQRGYESFVAALSRRFTVVTYLGAVGFWRATRTHHALAELFAAQTGELLAVGDLARLSARLAATLLAVLFGYAGYKRSIALQQNVDSLWVLWLGAGCLGYFAGSALHALFAQTHDAALACYLVQLELNRQGYNLQAGPRELQDALAESAARAKGDYRAMP